MKYFVQLDIQSMKITVWWKFDDCNRILKYKRKKVDSDKMDLGR